MIHTDQHGKPITVGDTITVKYCCGKYGQTRTVTGTLEEIDKWGGMRLTLSPETVPFTDDKGRLGCKRYNGDAHYVAFSWERNGDTARGYHEHRDFEHGHTCTVTKN